jgi:hypothetical protein
MGRPKRTKNRMRQDEKKAGLIKRLEKDKSFLFWNKIFLFLHHGQRISIESEEKTPATIVLTKTANPRAFEGLLVLS